MAKNNEVIRNPSKPLTKLLTIFFRLLYHQFAWTYDLVSWIVSWGQWQEWIMTPLPRLGSGKILELGFGPGHLQVAAAQRGKQIYGADLSPQMASIARKNITKSGAQPSLTLSDGRQLPFPNQTFNQVVATFPTEYIFTIDTLNEIYRILSKGGEFILLPVAWITGKRLVHRFLAWLFQITGQSFKIPEGKLEEFRHHFMTAGFNVEWQLIPFENSETLLIVARKEDHPEN